MRRLLLTLFTLAIVVGCNKDEEQDILPDGYQQECSCSYTITSMVSDATKQTIYNWFIENQLQTLGPIVYTNSSETTGVASVTSSGTHIPIVLGENLGEYKLTLSPPTWYIYANENNVAGKCNDNNLPRVRFSAGWYTLERYRQHGDILVLERYRHAPVGSWKIESEALTFYGIAPEYELSDSHERCILVKTN